MTIPESPLSAAEGGMKLSAPSDELLITLHDSGATIACLAASAVGASIWPDVRVRFLSLPEDAPGGLIVDCRKLPGGAAETIAPALYELLLAGRRRTPAVELAVVGKPHQSIGDAASAFLLPPR